jgi:hypothetical protein
MKLHLTLLFALVAGAASAQTGYTITQGEGYVDDVFFSLESGVVATVPAADWDLAFDVTGPFSATIRINDGHGRAVAVVPSVDAADWGTTIDSVGFAAEWPRLNNGITAWEEGALNVSPSGDPSDFSWGEYTGPPLHQVVGDSIYLLQRADASAFQFKIDNLDNGTWNLSYAALDGSGAETASINMADYAGKNFVYFNFTSGIVDREPLATDWDFVFTRYVGETIYGLFPTTGVLLNRLRPAAEVSETPVNEADVADVSLDVEDISVIGNDWKTLVDFQWQVAEDLSFFVEGADGGVYQIWFTDFTGSSTGVTEMNVLPVSTASTTPNNGPAQWQLYPNPVTSGPLFIGGSAGVQQAIIVDAQGRQVAQHDLNGQRALPTGRLPSGLYHVILFDGNLRESHSFLKH